MLSEDDSSSEEESDEEAGESDSGFEGVGEGEVGEEGEAGKWAGVEVVLRERDPRADLGEESDLVGLSDGDEGGLEDLGEEGTSSRLDLDPEGGNLVEVEGDFCTDIESSFDLTLFLLVLVRSRVRGRGGLSINVILARLSQS